MRLIPLNRLLVVVLLVFLGVFAFHLPVQANDKCQCKVHGDTGCTEDGATLDEICKPGSTYCCQGTICKNGTCVGGLFTKGQSAECLAKGNCSRCDLLIVLKNTFQFLVQIAGALAVLSIIIAGIMFMLGGGALGVMTTRAAAVGVEKARQALTAAIVGLIIVIFAWSMITWMMHFLGYEQAVGHAWWSIQCE